MSEDRKKPLWPWIAAVLIGLPVLYVASFGPACWLAARDSMPHVIAQLYVPLIACVAQCPDSIQKAVIDYCEFIEPEDIEIPSGYYFVTTGRQRYRARFLR